MAAKLILIIEDDTDIRDAFSEILGSLSGHQLLLAENGKVALEILRNTPELPDLILLDVLMPVMDGFAFRSEQLADNRLKEIPIVVLSASHRITDLAVKMQANAYLKKPISMDEFLEVIDRVANLR